MEWSKYQLAIFDAYENTNKNIVVEATAGSGKSKTLTELCNRTKEGTSCLFMAFNKSIAEELKTKLPTTVECNTFHSMGLRILMKNFRFRMQLEENKCFSLCMELFDFRKKEYKEKMRYYFALQELWEKIRLSLCEINERNVSALCIEYDLDYENSMINDLNKINERWRKDCAKIQDNKSFKMDFPDMLWIPYNFVDEMNFPKYQVVMADECFVGKTCVATSNGKMRIDEITSRINNGEIILVKSYNEQERKFELKKVLNASSKGHREVMKITVAGKRKIECTFNHLFLTAQGWKRADELSIGEILISSTSDQPYHRSLNQDQKDFVLISSIGDGSLKKISLNTYRCSFIHGEKQLEYLFWKSCLLGRYDDIEILTENGFSKKIAYRFSTRGICFYPEEMNKENILKRLSFKQLAILYMDDGSFNGSSVYLYSCATSKKLIGILSKRMTIMGIQNKIRESKSSSSGKTYWYLYVSASSWQIFFENIIPYVHPSMKYKIPKDYQHFAGSYKWDMSILNEGNVCVTNIAKEGKMGEVFDIEVEDNHNFIITSGLTTNIDKGKNANDGIVVHNCQDLFTLQKEILQRYIKPRGRFVAVGDSKQLIYNFMGSDLDVFNSIKGMPNTICLPLSVTYRCAKKIVEKANEVFPGTECTATAKEGVVRSGDIFEAESGDFVLCRNNFPLVVAFIMLLEKGKKASIMGRDFGENLCRLMDNQSCLDDLYLLLEDKASKLKKRGLSEIAIINNASYVALKEKVSIIETLYKRFPGSFLALKQKIKNIFSDDKTDIILSTIHKSKGLEAKRVFFLNPELIPSKFAKTPKALYAEDCLKFVAITRAKEELVYCHINTKESPL